MNEISIKLTEKDFKALIAVAALVNAELDAEEESRHLTYTVENSQLLEHFLALVDMRLRLRK